MPFWENKIKFRKIFFNISGIAQGPKYKFVDDLFQNFLSFDKAK